MTETIHDFAAIGLGPFNLGLACLSAPVPELDGVFLDENPGFDWHPGMMLEDATLQTPFLADLVTMADPTSPYSFLSYAKEEGHLYSFYIRENFFLLRTEFNRYCQWAAARAPGIEFNTRVRAIDYDHGTQAYRIHSRCTRTGADKRHRARRLVLGTGTVPYRPPVCDGLGERVVHSADYLRHKAALQRQPRITVVGSGQSAAEIVHDLLGDIDRHGYALHWITRSPRFIPLEYSRLTLEMTSPEYVDYFHALPEASREALLDEHQRLYKGINDELIAAIRDRLYTKRAAHPVEVILRAGAELEGAAADPTSGELALTFRHREQGRRFRHRTDALVLATGYAYRVPDCVRGIADRLRWDDHGRLDARRDYTIDRAGNGEVFVQNAELHTHGFVTPDLGMGSYRNACIINRMAGRACYSVEERIGFQTFGVAPDEALDEPLAPARAAGEAG